MPARGANGRFAKGNSGGPGRPKRQTEREYLRTTAQACSLNDWAEVVGRAVEDAKGGDPKAREWLSDRLMGTDIDLTKLAIEIEAGIDPLSESIFFQQASDLSGFRPGAGS